MRVLDNRFSLINICTQIKSLHILYNKYMSHTFPSFNVHEPIIPNKLCTKPSSIDKPMVFNKKKRVAKKKKKKSHLICPFKI